MLVVLDGYIRTNLVGRQADIVAKAASLSRAADHLLSVGRVVALRGENTKINYLTDMRGMLPHGISTSRA